MINQQPYPGGTPLLRSLAIQGRVIGALLMREILTRFGRHNIGFLWLFVEPMMFTLGITVMWNFVKVGHDGNLPITAFAITGYGSVLIWRNTVMRCIDAIGPNLSLMYHRNVRVFDLFAARIMLELAGAIMSFVILSLLFIFIGLMKPPADILEVFFGLIMLSWFGAALALFIGGLATKSELVDKIWHPVSYLMFPFSGAMFMVNWLSPPFQKVVLWFPMVNGTEILREGYFGNIVQAHYSVAYMAFVNLIFTFLGLALIREAGRHIEP